MVTVNEIYRSIDEKAPFSLQEDFDNAGFLVGRGEQAVKKVLVSLDITEPVVEEARRLGAQLIVAHHPVIFYPAKSITDADPTGRILLGLTEGHIAAICAHTNLDAVEGGVNDALARALGLTGIRMLRQEGVDRFGRPYGIGRAGIVMEMTLSEFSAVVKTALRANGVRAADGGRPVHCVAVGGGACADMMGDALALGCDTFVTSDVKYNGFLDAAAMGLNLIDAGHFPTEDVVCPVLRDWLNGAFPELEISISQEHREVTIYH